jgi:hypothetical protein
VRVLTTSLSSSVAQALVQAHNQAVAAAAGAPQQQQRQQQQQQQQHEQQHSAQAPPPAAGTVAPGGAAGAGTAAGAAGVGTAAGANGGSSTQHWERGPADLESRPSSSGVGRGVEPHAGGGGGRRGGRDWLLAQLAGGGSGGGSGAAARITPEQQPQFKGSSRGPGLSVIVCESRPLCEGVTLARRLAAAGLDVTLVTDAQAGVFVREADAVLLGADAVTPQGVVNKAGSLLLALAARAAGVPVLAVATTLKVSPGPVADVALPNTQLAVRAHRACCGRGGEEGGVVPRTVLAWGTLLAVG